MTRNESMTICLVGDDRAREYPILWTGVADDLTTEDRRELVDVPVALLGLSDGREALIYLDPNHGWTSVNAARCTVECGEDIAARIAAAAV